MVTNKRPGNSPDPSNSYSAQCQSNGQWKVSSKQCKVLPAGCGAQTVYWNQSLNWDTSAKGCYGPTTAAQNGQTVKVIDQNPSQETSDPGNYATWACLDGSWSATGGQCLEIQPDKNKPLTKTVPVVCGDTWATIDLVFTPLTGTRGAVFGTMKDVYYIPTGAFLFKDSVINTHVSKWRQTWLLGSGGSLLNYFDNQIGFYYELNQFMEAQYLWYCAYEVGG